MESTYNSSVTLQIEEILNAAWPDKKFIYRSKYGGETFGIISKVKVSSAIVHDATTSAILTELFKPRKNRVTIEPAQPEDTWRGSRLKISIISTNNIVYDLDEIFIIDDTK